MLHGSQWTPVPEPQPRAGRAGLESHYCSAVSQSNHGVYSNNSLITGSKTVSRNYRCVHRSCFYTSTANAIVGFPIVADLETATLIWRGHRGADPRGVGT